MRHKETDCGFCFKECGFLTVFLIARIWCQNGGISTSGSPNFTISKTSRYSKWIFMCQNVNNNVYIWSPNLAMCAAIAKIGGCTRLYFSMVQSRMMYRIHVLTWGFDYYRIEKLQKRFVRIISSSKYNAHSEPLFKVLDILKIEHLFSQSCLKFVYKFKKSQLPKYFLFFQCVPRSSIHDHDTRGAEQVDTIYTRTHMAAKCIRSLLPVILNDTPDMIIIITWLCGFWREITSVLP